MLSILSKFNVKFNLFSSILKYFKLEVQKLLFKIYAQVYVTIIFQTLILECGRICKQLIKRRDNNVRVYK